MMKTLKPKQTIRFVVVIAATTTILLGSPFAQAQQIDFGFQQEIQINPGRMVIRGDLIGNPLNGNRNVDENVDTSRGAILKTDPDLEQILQKAERYKNDGNYLVAAQLWQAVLDKSGDTLYSEDGEVYFSLVRQVERILAQLPEKGLSDYRIKADAEALQILAQGRGPLDEQSLSRIVRKFFVSSIGDDAAFKLACINLDQHDFIGALRLLKKIVEQHPDPSIPLDQVLVRASLCQAIMGDIESAKANLDQAKELTDGSVADLINMVSETIEKVAVAASDFSLGNNGTQFAKYRVMPLVPDEFMNRDLVCTWQAAIEPEDPVHSGTPIEVYMGTDAHGSRANGTVNQNIEKEMINQWRAQYWRPAGDLLFDQNRVYFKSTTRMTAWRTDQLSKQAVWKSAWTNYFQLDEASKILANMRRGGFNMSNQFSKPLYIQLFGDQIFQQMAIHNGTLYSIEGNEFDKNQRLGASRNGRIAHGVSYRRGRENRLVAYEASSGRALWVLPQLKVENRPGTPINPNPDDEETSEFLLSGGFMSAPIGHDNLLLVPVNSGGAIWVYALDANNQGKTVWRSFLCDEPDTGAEPLSPIKMSLSGSDLIVNCGMGVVFIVDASTGMIQFAKRYERSGEQTPTINYGGQTPRLSFDGWSSDEVIPYGNQMICFSSDTNVINAFELTSGKMVWNVDMTPIGMNKLDYILGIQNDVLYLAGSETIIAFDLKGEGLMLWGGEELFDGKKSCGRGMLTPNGIYMPIEDSIWKFDLAGHNTSAKKIGDVTVDLGTGAPVGNLYSDGKRIWVLGGNRIYALAPETK